MNEQEVRAIIALAMSYDNRKFPGDANIAAWAEQADRNGWTFETAREAIHQCHGKVVGFLMPAHITEVLDGVRARIRKQIADDKCDPPRELRDDPRAEIEWRRNRSAEYTQRALSAWARREELPELDQPQALEGRERPQLGPALRHLVEGAAIPPEHRPAKPARRKPSPANDPARRVRMARARAEIEKVRREQGEAS